MLEPTPRLLRLLIVEDSEDDATLIHYELQRGGYAVTYQRVDTPAAMRTAIEQKNWDVITSDHSMPAFSAPAALKLAQELCPEIPFIIISNEIDLNLVVSLMKNGAHDYIQKGELPRIVPLIQRELEEVELRHKQRQAEEDRRISEEKFYKAFHNSPDGIYLTRFSDGVYLAVNQGFERITGYSAAEVMGKSTLTLNIWVDPDERTRLAEKLLQDGEFNNEEGLARIKNEALIPVQTSARLITVNGEKCVLVFSRDMSKQKQAEEEIRRQNRELQAVSQIIAATTTQLDVSQILTEALNGAIKLLGLECGAVYLLNQADQVLFFAAACQFSPTQETFMRNHPIHMDGAICQQLTVSQKPLTLAEGSFPSVSPAIIFPGEDFPFQVIFPLLVKGQLTGIMYLATPRPTLAPTPNSIELAQQLCGAVALALENAHLYETVQKYVDELEERVAERTEQLLATNLELESFSFSVAHDLRTPLRAIGGFNQILRADFADQFNAESKHYLDRIAITTQRMQQLIEDLLALSRITRVELKHELVDLSALARAIASEFGHREPERHLTWHISENLQANGDPNLLRTVLENLIGNAWKFTTHQPQAQIEFGAKISPTETIYFVRDNGAGFNPEHAQRLFGPFQRLHSESEFAGNGIGLASVRRIVLRHGGKVWADGQVNQGATFYFTLK